MIVTKQGQPHNHEQNFANHIRKDLMEEIQKQAIDFYYAKTGAIVEKVLAENEAFGSFYESGSCFPQKKSMFRAVQRAREGVRPPNVDDPDFVLEQRGIELANFFRGEVTVKKARHFIFVTNTQLKFMSEAYAWYIDGTFKICRDPVKQLLTIHVVMNVSDQCVSLPVCFVLMSRRRQIDCFAVLSEINRLCCKYIQDHSKNRLC